MILTLAGQSQRLSYTRTFFKCTCETIAEIVQQVRGSFLQFISQPHFTKHFFHYNGNLQFMKFVLQTVDIKYWLTLVVTKSESCLVLCFLISRCSSRPFPSFPLFQSESKCEICVVVISLNFNMNDKWYSRQRFFSQPRLERELEGNSEMAHSLGRTILIFDCAYVQFNIIS